MELSPQLLLATPALAVRARQLTEARQRARLARSLRRLVADAEDPLGDRYGVIAPGYGRTVRAWREGLLGIAERLEEPVPVSATAVARAVTLLTDGTSPLYWGGCRHSLADAIWWVADSFQDCPPHAWGCPVVMKVDPHNVAWSCSRCGAMGFSGDSDAPPS